MLPRFPGDQVLVELTSRLQGLGHRPGEGQVSILTVMEAPKGWGDKMVEEEEEEAEAEEGSMELQRSLPTIEEHSYRMV